MLTNLLSRVRRNHGLEHATIHMLSERHKNFNAQGNSDHLGFNLNVYGEISETEVATAVYEALRRLRSGQHNLAVHPNCGTVLLTTATMATLAAQTMITMEQRRQNRSITDLSVLLNAMPSAIMAVTLSLLISRPIGVQLQAQYTVEGDPKGLEIIQVRRISPSPITRLFKLLLTGNRPDLRATAYRIETRG